MKRTDLEPSNENILKSLERDTLGRNPKLAGLIRLLNAIDENYIISIDGPWGSGKTFFIEQLRYLHKTGSLPSEIAPEQDIENFRKKYHIIYYNAWEHDDHTEHPLESLIRHILLDQNVSTMIRQAGEKSIKLVEKLVKMVFRTTVSPVVASQIEEILKTIKENEDENQIKNVADIEDKKQLFDKLLKDISGEQRILLIVDDLDRSRPDFAIKLLETLKHFYNNDKITIIVATNNNQLASSVEHFYGNNTDGFRYLNRIYDTTLYLPVEHIENYLIFHHKLAEQAITDVVISLSIYHNFSYRECNRFMTMYKITTNYLNNNSRSHGEKKEKESLFCSFVIIFLLSLKIVNPESYALASSGNTKPLKDYLIFLSNKDNDPYKLLGWIYDVAEPTQRRDLINLTINDIMVKYKEVLSNKDGLNIQEASSLLGTKATYHEE